MDRILRMRLLMVSIATIFALGLATGQNCPTGDCPTAYKTIVQITDLPNCATGQTTSVTEDIDNSSGCEIQVPGPGNGTVTLNCYQFIIQRPADSNFTGIQTDVGQGNGAGGNGCTGELSGVYSAGTLGSPNPTTCDDITEGGGSQITRTLEFDFDSDEITVWLCDNSSGQVSLCLLCAESDGPTPVDFASFDAKLESKSVSLSWSTASEDNNLGFGIERSTDGRYWEVLEFVEGRGNSSEMVYYSYQDDNPRLGNNYYRLKQMDFDGQFEYSKVVTVDVQTSVSNLVKVFPNPTSGVFQVNLTNPHQERASVKILDSTGRVVWMQEFDAADAQVNWSQEFDLPKQEVYFLVTQVGNQIDSQKILVLDDK